MKGFKTLHDALTTPKHNECAAQVGLRWLEHVVRYHGLQIASKKLFDGGAFEYEVKTDCGKIGHIMGLRDATKGYVLGDIIEPA
jgi:hypothetical protein